MKNSTRTGLFCSKHPGVTLLQYVDDLLLSTNDKEDCLRATLGLPEL